MTSFIKQIGLISHTLADKIEIEKQEDIIEEDEEKEKEKPKEPEYLTEKQVFGNSKNKKKTFSTGERVFRPLEIRPIAEEEYKDPRFKNVPIQLPYPPFLWLIISSVGGGKTTMLSNIVYDKSYGYYPHFDDTIFMSPTIECDVSGGSFLADEKIKKITGDELSNLEGILKELFERKSKEAAEDERDKKVIRRNTLLIMDDMLGLIGRTSEFEKLMVKYRHPLISIIITTQIYKKIPNTAREQLRAASIFSTGNKTEMKKYEEEFSGNFPNFMKCYKFATSKKYGFLHMNIKDRRIFSSFKEELEGGNEDFQ